MTNNIQGISRDLKKIRDTKGTFNAKMGSIKNRNVMDLTEAEDTSVSLLLSRTQAYCYHLSKFHIYALVYCIGVFLSGKLYGSMSYI